MEGEGEWCAYVVLSVGTNLLNSQTVAIKFVSTPFPALLLVVIVLEGLVGALGVLEK